MYLGVDKLIHVAVGERQKEDKSWQDPFWVKPVAIAHNALMSLYSGWTFLLMAAWLFPRIGSGHFYDFDLFDQCPGGSPDLITLALY